MFVLGLVPWILAQEPAPPVEMMKESAPQTPMDICEYVSLCDSHPLPR